MYAIKKAKLATSKDLTCKFTFSRFFPRLWLFFFSQHTWTPKNSHESWVTQKWNKIHHKSVNELLRMQVCYSNAMHSMTILIYRWGEATSIQCTEVTVERFVVQFTGTPIILVMFISKYGHMKTYILKRLTPKE